MAAAASSAGAAISSMMTLMRKQSFRNDFVPLLDYNQEDPTGDSLEWMNKTFVKYTFRLTGLLSFISTCMNTPKTFEYHPYLQYVTFVIDIKCVIILTIEAAAKMKARGILMGESSYLRDRWNHFDAIMVLSIYLSIILQVDIYAR
jgi:sodium leak channel non-selective protein